MKSAELKAAVEATQAREQQLRDGILAISKEIPKTMGRINLQLLKTDLDNLLALPTDTTALKELNHDKP